MNQLFKNLHQNKYRSTIDNQVPKNYESGKKILKDKIKKNRYENAAKREHQREIELHMNKMENCKSLVERRKDKTDPIVNPTYFMRDNSNAQSVTIEAYKNKVLKKNRPVSGNYAHSTQLNLAMESKQLDSFEEGPAAFGQVPNYGKGSKQRPASAVQPKNK